MGYFNKITYYYNLLSRAIFAQKDILYTKLKLNVMAIQLYSSYLVLNDKLL